MSPNAPKDFLEQALKDELLDDVKKMIEELARDTGVPVYKLNPDLYDVPEHPNCRCETSYVSFEEAAAYAQYVHVEGEIPLSEGVVLLTYKAEQHHPEFRARLVGLADVHGRCWRTRAVDWQAGQLALLLDRVENVQKRR